MGKRVYLLLTIIVSLLVLGTAKESLALDNSKRKVKAVEANASNNVTTIAKKVPYSIEITEQSAPLGSVITLATNAITIIKCPEEPVNFHLGSTIGIDAYQAAEFDKSVGRNEIYVRPRVDAAGINTNLVIEFQSGPIAIYFHVIELKNGNNAGDFTGEVVIKNSHYKDELTQANQKLLAANTENEKLLAHTKELEKQLQDKITSACDEDKLTILRIVEDNVIFTTRKNTIEQANIKISQLGRLQKTKNGWIISFVLENRTKDFVSLNKIESLSNKVITTWELPKKLSPKAETKLSLLIDADLKEMPTEVTFFIGSTPLKVKTSY